MFVIPKWTAVGLPRAAPVSLSLLGIDHAMSFYAPQYVSAETKNVATFVAALKENAVPSKDSKGGTLDSVAAAHDFVMSVANQNDREIKVPQALQAVLDEAPKEESGKITKAILDSVSGYERLHGVPAPADVVEQALHSAYTTTDAARRKYSLDSATSNHHDPLSLQPNRAVVAILSAMAEAIPFAHYLPADIGSNKAILAILSHNAGSDFGGYAQNGLMDGTHSGSPYISSARTNAGFPDADTGAVSGKITGIQTGEDSCDQAAPNIKLLRGRSLVYINGVPVAREVESTGSGNSTVSGRVTIGSTEYLIGGAINTDTGVYALTTSPKLPATVPVLVEGFIDFERAPELTPSIITAVNTFELLASPWRAATHQTIDSRTQMANELGLDPYGESVMAIQNQFANERHYEVLRKAKRLGALNQIEHDFAWAARSALMSRAQIWADFAGPLGAVSQQMAVDTLNHGVTHLYVGKKLAAQWMALPRELFEPSGITARPGIYRIGRLLGIYEVYYSPKVVSETETSAQVLCVGRATDVTRNPFVLGDAVPPTVVPLAVGTDLRQGAGFYARNFTCVNPHAPSARGCALINIINL